MVLRVRSLLFASPNPNPPIFCIFFGHITFYLFPVSFLLVLISLFFRILPDLSPVFHSCPFHIRSFSSLISLISIPMPLLSISRRLSSPFSSISLDTVSYPNARNSVSHCSFQGCRLFLYSTSISFGYSLLISMPAHPIFSLLQIVIFLPPSLFPCPNGPTSSLSLLLHFFLVCLLPFVAFSCLILNAHVQFLCCPHFFVSLPISLSRYFVNFLSLCPASPLTFDLSFSSLNAHFSILFFPRFFLHKSNWLLQLSITDLFFYGLSHLSYFLFHSSFHSIQISLAQPLDRSSS
ncbi:hypothetical protein B0J11DRAFT_51103 [Dendryphion nanum]|uniref:Uncharacterized protein n=1 Tax=Dendryphion nanum TaxID=256645 RepID=A0A9P9DHT2_9PLEO|nr:hypothetical protein B0J11DRAFT_51103 [Dendryphion nanum]